MEEEQEVLSIKEEDMVECIKMEEEEEGRRRRWSV